MRIRNVFLISLALVSIVSIRLRGSIASAQQKPPAVFFGARLEPPAGRVLSGWGEFPYDWGLRLEEGKRAGDDLDAYEKAVAPHPPGAVSFYVTADSAPVAKFLQSYREFASKRGFFVAEVGVEFHGAEHDVSIGMRDPALIVLADGLREVGRPVLLRIGDEFNNFAYQPSDYIGAFRHTVQVFHQDKTNFAAVWDGNARDFFSDPHYMKWYPGDDVVDWWGLDVSSLGDFGGTESNAFLQDALRHRKPVIINGSPALAKSEAQALQWYASFFDFIRANPAIKAFRIHPTMRLTRWRKAGAYVRQRLADPRFIDASEASSVFRQSRQN